MRHQRWPAADRPPSARTPLRVLLLALLLTFAVEEGIMLVLPRLPESWHGESLESLIDASVLTFVMAPFLWILAVSPLRRALAARGRLVKQLFESVEQERSAISHDLHDSVGQDLTAVLVGLRAIESAETLNDARTRASDLREFATQAHREVRRLARGLRPVALEELGLGAALERLCESFQAAHGVAVALVYDPSSNERIDSETKTALYRIVQEALTNVARHAAANEVDVRVAMSGESATLTIRDDGRGFDVSDARAGDGRDSGLGLSGIRERALMLGGTCTVRTQRGRGTTIDVRVPLRER